MKKTILFAAAVGMVLTGCSTSDETAESLGLAQTNAEEAISFGTYLGEQVRSRADIAGAGQINSLDNLRDAGFGVFAFFTGNDTYAETNYGSSPIAPNFMYNQMVEKDGTDNWKYSPIKYWPNDIASTDVDQQPATGSSTYGGKVSFFAYAPYVAVTQHSTDATQPATTGNASGIISVTGNEATGDPILNYVLGDVTKTSDKDFGDLLWGTLLSATQNVLDKTVTDISNTGVQGKSAGNTYEQAIYNAVGETWVNADLVKQKVDGQVGFAFRHALAKVGGAQNGSGTANGLMIVLDVDKDGAIVGGDLEAGLTGSGSTKNTKVTVKSINIEAVAKNSASTSTTDDYFVKPSGSLNLATGAWTLNTASSDLNDKDHVQTTTIAIPSGTTNELNEQIAEVSKTTFADFPDGVPAKTPVNVFKTEGQPLYFIPGTFPELKVTVDYIVRTYDPNLAAGWTTVEQKITKTVTFAEAVKMNKQYNLLIHLGLTGIKFTADYTPWEVAGGTANTDLDGDGTDDIYTENVHVPLNVK